MIRRAVRLAALLYPAQWRVKYGEEFAALIEDSGGGWRALGDVLKGAIAMQLRAGGWLKWVAACGVAGALLAGAAYWRTPKKYVSTAVLRVTGGDLDRFVELEQAVLSRTSLVQVIQQNELYKEARAEQPIEDIVQEMRQHDLAITPVSAPDNSEMAAFSVSYSANDPRQAQTVTNALVRHFQAESADKITVELLDPASLPVRAVSPRRDRWVMLGLALGLMVGLAALGVRRWPWIAATGLAGALAGLAISAALPEVWISNAVVRGDVAEQAASLVDDATVERLLSDPSLNLYPDQRGSLSPGLLARQLRNNLSIKVVHPPRGWDSSVKPTALISFRYPNPAKAQEVTRRILARFVQAGPFLVLDPPTKPDEPTQPRPIQWSAVGLLVGLLCGMGFMLVRSRSSHSPAQA